VKNPTNSFVLAPRAKKYLPCSSKKNHFDGSGIFKPQETNVVVKGFSGKSGYLPFGRKLLYSPVKRVLNFDSMAWVEMQSKVSPKMIINKSCRFLKVTASGRKNEKNCFFYIIILIS
jgi:hypothetical protein